MLAILKHKSYGQSELSFLNPSDLAGIIGTASVFQQAGEKVEVWNVTETEAVQVYPKPEPSEAEKAFADEQVQP